MKFYVAAPLCSEAERFFNLRVDELLRGLGLETYLPQRDGGLLTDLVKQGLAEDEIRRRLFQLDVAAMDSSDVILAVLDGRTIDEGVCFELGYMYAKGKRCLAFKTDARTYIRGRINLMIDGSLVSTATNWDNLTKMVNELKEHYV